MTYMSNVYNKLIFNLGIVQIGKGLRDEAPMNGESKRTGSLNKASRSPTRNQESGTVLL